MVPFLVLATMGTLDLGRAFYDQIAITNAAREGTRVAVSQQYFGPSMTCPGPTCPLVSDAAIKARVTQEIIGTGIALSPTAIVIAPPESDRTNFVNSGLPSTYPLTVTVTYRFGFITPIIGNLLGGQINVVGSSTMRTEY